LEQIVNSVRGEHPSAKPAWGVASYAVINVTSRQDRISTSYSHVPIIALDGTSFREMQSQISKGSSTELGLF